MRSLLTHIFVVFIALAMLMGCKSNQLTNQDSNYQYDTKIKDLQPSFRVYHVNDTLTYLYFELATSNLLYVRENSSKPFEAEIHIKYELYEDEKGKVLADSATKILYDYKKGGVSNKILARIPLNIPFDSRGLLKLTSRDINKRVVDEQFINIDKADRLSDQFFLFKNAVNNSIYFDNYFTLTNNLIAESEYNKNGTFEVHYYNTNYPASPPPFSSVAAQKVVTYRDSSYLLSFSDGKGDVYLPKLGSYYIKPFDSVRYNIVLQKLDSNFSGFRNYLGMIEPLKYICTSREYKALVNAKDRRKAVEQLWLKMAGSKERARTIIEEYYRRVELANKYFTSYKEGWKTDRGMLSIVMGLPNTIYKTRKGETWVYGTPHNMMLSLTFSFNLENEEKVKNDYQLIRYRTYRDYWYRACESWRQGRIYNFN